MALLGCLEVTLQALTKGSVRFLEIHDPHKGGVSLWRSNDATVPVAGDPWSYKGSASCRSTRIVAMAGDLQNLTTVSVLWDLRRRMFSLGFWRSAAPQGQYQLLDIPGATWAAPVVDPRSHKYGITG